MNNIHIEDMTQEWLNPRVFYLRKIIKPLPTTCPECEHSLEHDEFESYCPDCGLVVSTSIEYVAGIRIDLPYGRH